MDKPIGKYLNDMACKFRKAVRNECDKKGIPSSYFHILMYLEKNKDEEVYQNDIVDFAKFKPSTVSVSLSNMEKEKLITRTKDKMDGRRTIIKLTNSGLAMGNIIKNVFDSIENDLKECITNEEETMMKNVANKINERLERWCG